MELRPDKTGKIVPDMPGFLNSTISGKAVVVENKLELQGLAVDHEQQDETTEGYRQEGSSGE